MKKFVPICADLTNYINAATTLLSKKTDAPKDIHEAYALLHLSCACMDLRWKVNLLSDHKERLNLFFAYYGNSGEARKSTCMGINREFLRQALNVGPPEITPFFSGDSFTPQGLRDGMIDRKGIPTIVAFDEMDDIFEAVSNRRSPMAQLPHMFKSLYSKSDFYTRLSSQNKNGDIMIEDSYLCMIGNITPACPKRVTENHLTDGFIARIHIIKATEPFDRRGMIDGHSGTSVDRDEIRRMEADEAKLRNRLSQIQNAILSLNENERLVKFSMPTLEAIDEVEREIERRKSRCAEGHPAIYSLDRIHVTLVKVAILVAAGRMGGAEILKNRGVDVTPEDVADSAGFCRKLMDNIMEFIRLATESVEATHSSLIRQWAIKLMHDSGKNYFLDSPLVRKGKDKFGASGTRDIIAIMLRTGELVPAPDADPKGRVAYRLPAPPKPVEPVATYEPLPPDKNEDPKLPGQDEPF